MRCSRHMRNLVVAPLVAAGMSYAQSNDQTFTSGQVRYFQSTLLVLSSRVIPSSLFRTTVDNFGAQFGMNESEVGVVLAAVSEFRTDEQSRVASVSNVLAPTAIASPAAQATLAAIEHARTQQAIALGKRILSSIRPEVAARLLAVGSAMDQSLQRRGR